MPPYRLNLEERPNYLRAKEKPVNDSLDALILDLLDWIGPDPRPYAEVMEAWRTSCPRLPVWEEANERGYITRCHEPEHGALVSVTPQGRDFQASRRPLRRAGTMQLQPEESRVTRISILYPNKNGARFDMGYYVEKHMPMSIALLSAHPGFRGVCVERGIGGAIPGTDAAYIAMCHFEFNSAADFLEAFMPHSQTLQGDIPNYTDVEPTIQVNEVLISR